MPRAPFNPVVLMLVALPVATLAAGAATLAIIGRGGLDRVGDPVRRTAQVQQVDLRADEAARRIGVSGRIALEDGIAKLHLVGAPAGIEGETLGLHLEHPLDAQADAERPLRFTDGRWQAEGFDRDVGWRVSVGPEDGRWRIVARWPRGAAAAALEPAVDGRTDVAAR